MLPDIDGIEVGRRLRARGFKTAILFLTAKDAIENKVEALRAGGDDYVTKPFSLAEIVARVQAILRRTAGDLPGDVLRFADLVARRGPPRGLPRRRRRSTLTATEFNLLRFFLLNPRRVLSKGQILQNVWRYDFGGNSNVVETYVSYLRQKLDAAGPPLIRTVRQVGYMLEAERSSMLAATVAARPARARRDRPGRGRAWSPPTSRPTPSLRSFLDRPHRRDAQRRARRGRARALPAGGPARGPGGGIDTLTGLPRPAHYVQVRQLDGAIVAARAACPQSREHEPPPPPKLPATITLPTRRREPAATASATSPSPRRERRRPLPRPRLDRAAATRTTLLIVATSLDERRQHAAPAAPDRAARHGRRPRRDRRCSALWVVRLGLRPLAAIERDRGARSPPATSRSASSAPTSRTEVGRLGLALNAMLGQIESGVPRARGVRARSCAASSPTPRTSCARRSPPSAPTPSSSRAAPPSGPTTSSAR